MAIKKLHVSFDISVEDFTRMLMGAGNMAVQVYGDGALKPPVKPQGHKPVTSSRTPSDGRPGMRKLILAHLTAHPEESFSSGDLLPLIVAGGYPAGSIYGILLSMTKSGWAKRKGDRYLVSAKALKHAQVQTKTEETSSGDQA